MILLRALLACLLLSLVAACGKGDTLIGNEAADVSQINTTAGPTVAEVLARGDDSVAAEPKPVAFDQAGAWAASAAQCGGAQWRFTTNGVSAADGSECRQTAADIVSGTSKKLTMRCTAEGIETIENWALNLHPDGTMTVSRSEGGNGIPRSTTLRRCG